ncbi:MULTISPECIES: myo-inosose-2 dehydratase [Bartonella]|uniref:myo-inosose-2 dehydratase n=1 Tax=Bartonella TaxID=773 RepID=UPI0018DD8CC2|nr:MULTISPECIES: myo-inosose-2 dehydratase [Bartonella]MBH9974457.1 myo-inosose-2 dehydratase [Bartonella choladocola]MBI0014064.1 myo-inosose-2 dehydratase [Bartonella sp. B10834G3]MBI0139894.1 myo-inosose-2 dehydratase [Bartonella choladocola]
MKARLAACPIAWTNDDLPELGGDTPVEQCLEESRKAGYSGTEMGGKFPRETNVLRQLLANNDLALAASWYSGTLLDNNLEAEKKQALPLMKLLRDLDVKTMVYGEVARSIQGQRHVPLNKRPQLNDDEILGYAQKMNDFADWCLTEDIQLAYHHHLGAVIEREHDIDRFLAATKKSVGLLFDTGHLVMAGVDPLSILKKYGKRVVHVHCKDVRENIMNGIDRDRSSFLDCVLEGVFTVPGDGMIDFQKICDELAAQHYQGWFVVEAEQDPEKAPPLQYATMGYNYLKKCLDNSGYIIE